MMKGIMLSRIVLWLAVQFTLTNAMTLRSCTKVTTYQELEEAIHTEVSNIITLCPFELWMKDTIHITRSDISIVCHREEPTDLCTVYGWKRHINVSGTGVTLIGFDFERSTSGAVQVMGETVSFIDCTFKL
jgi:hypothetical protein